MPLSRDVTTHSSHTHKARCPLQTGRQKCPRTHVTHMCTLRTCPRTVFMPGQSFEKESLVRQCSETALCVMHEQCDHEAARAERHAYRVEIARSFVDPRKAFATKAFLTDRMGTCKTSPGDARDLQHALSSASTKRFGCAPVHARSSREAEAFSCLLLSCLQLSCLLISCLQLSCFQPGLET